MRWDAIAILFAGALLLGAGIAGTRATRETTTGITRRHYATQLKRLRRALNLYERSLKQLGEIRTYTPPRLFTVSSSEVRKVLAVVHRRETRVCVTFALINALKTRSEVPMSTTQVASFRKLGRRFTAAVRKLRELEALAKAKGVRFDDDRPCPSGPPDIKQMEAAMLEDAERRESRRKAADSDYRRRRRKARAKADKQAKGPAEDRDSRPSSGGQPGTVEEQDYLVARVNAMYEQAEYDDDAMEDALLANTGLLERVWEHDIDMFVQLAEKFPGVQEYGIKRGHLEDATKSAFEE
jgi:hypothetical protein